ncbi:MAG: hypothetical protein HY791_23915 [Deltaproteobacteria bacterium]|nr:hypothetical protein [Deltaproteobacteria bacterium]
MSIDRFVGDTRSALSALVGTGAVSAGADSVRAWRSLSARAESLGLTDLSRSMSELARQLEHRGALAFEASPPLANVALTIFDRVEALASTAALWRVEEMFEGDKQ